MTDKTKKLFDAPWVLFSDPENEVFEIESNSGDFITEATMFETANRLSHLPELYDALVEAAYEFCHNCISLTGDSEYVPDSDEFIEKGCPKKIESCFCRKWWGLLRNVRDGK